MTVFLRTAGALLLILAGAGGGFAAAARIGTQQRQCHAFARLLAYLAELLEAQALAGPELLARAARCPTFSACCPAGTAELSALRPPDCLPDALCREIAETLAAAPRRTAGAALRRLAALCEAEADELAARAHDARRLWPRLGGCLGVLAAILLW